MEVAKISRPFQWCKCCSSIAVDNDQGQYYVEGELGTVCPAMMQIWDAWFFYFFLGPSSSIGRVPSFGKTTVSRVTTTPLSTMPISTRAPTNTDEHHASVSVYSYQGQIQEFLMGGGGGPNFT